MAYIAINHFGNVLASQGFAGFAVGIFQHFSNMEEKIRCGGPLQRKEASLAPRREGERAWTGKGVGACSAIADISLRKVLRIVLFLGGLADFAG